jgi:twinkle protein
MMLDDPSWMECVSTGSEALDRIIKIPKQGRFWVVTGIPNMGKSTFLNWLFVSLAAREGWKGALFSPETDPWQLHAMLLSEIFTGKRWRNMNMDDKVKAVSFVGAHFTHIVPNDTDAVKGLSSLDWLMEQVRIAVLRDGIKFVLIDPWNELEHSRPGNMNTAEYANNVVARLKAACRKWGVHLFLVAHPKKLEAGEVPTGYSIADAAAFANKADFGLTVHLPNMSKLVEIRVWKCRFRVFGKKGKAWLEWDENNDRYTDCPDQPAD